MDIPKAMREAGDLINEDFDELAGAIQKNKDIMLKVLERLDILEFQVRSILDDKKERKRFPLPLLKPIAIKTTQRTDSHIKF